MHTFNQILTVAERGLAGCLGITYRPGDDAVD
jgi:hypothetical protein